MANAKKQKIDKLCQIMAPDEGRISKTDEEYLKALKQDYPDLNFSELEAYLRRHHKQAEQTEEATPTEKQSEANPFRLMPDERLRLLTEAPGKVISYGAKMELAKRDFFEFCYLRNPDFYRRSRAYLIRLCGELQSFYKSDELIMIINAPPRHGKSYTAQNFTEWAYGIDPTEKIMTGSYNETLSTTFSKKVRDDISEVKADPEKIVYHDIFPDTRIKQGDAAMNLWSLEGQYASYLATSPGGTATGFGASMLIVDDLIKSAMEAYNADLLDTQWRWFTDTMLSRLEEGGKIILIMTRWASGDLAGRVQKHFKEQEIPCRVLSMKALQDDGTMLCEEVLSKASYLMKTKAMSAEIASANYQQIPVDIKGRLYSSLKTYTALPQDTKGKSLFSGVRNYTDTADTGSDFLCSIVYGVYQSEAYILDVLYTQDGMEKTEPATAKMLVENGCNDADIESNNGGRGFARNVGTEIKSRYHSNRCVIHWFYQSLNKQARILTNSTWVMEHIYFPANWRDRWPDFYRDVTGYQKAGKNAHDDAPDALTGIAEHFNKPLKRLKFGKRRFGL